MSLFSTNKIDEDVLGQPVSTDWLKDNGFKIVSFGEYPAPRYSKIDAFGGIGVDEAGTVIMSSKYFAFIWLEWFPYGYGQSETTLFGTENQPAGKLKITVTNTMSWAMLRSYQLPDCIVAGRPLSDVAETIRETGSIEAWHTCTTNADILSIITELCDLRESFREQWKWHTEKYQRPGPWPSKIKMI